jgi:acetoin utilization protein AcuC
MSGSALFVWDDRLRAYDFGPGHPLAPIRVELAMLLARDLGLLEPDRIRTVMPVEVPPEVLAAVHEQHFIDAMKASTAATQDLQHGLGTPDNPAFDGMHDAAVRVVGATLAAVQGVWSGDVLHGVNLAGGLHHSMPGSASGFCLYNDLAVGIQWALDNGAERVAYVDVDVHHGDGVQEVFADDPRVLTISLHESPESLFPGTGYPSETGRADGGGSAANVALPAGTDDAQWLRAFDAIVPPLLRAFKPQLLVSQHGVDSHAQDPLAHMALSIDGQRAAMQALHSLAHEVCEGRWVATGGGGYEWVQVVPRAWAHLVGIASGHPVEPTTAVPEGWREYVAERLGRQAPGRMTDGVTPTYRRFVDGHNDSDPVDAAILETRRAVFGHFGLEVESAN